MHEKFMREAIIEANKAKMNDDVPVGAVIVRNNKIIARGFNTREKEKKATGHAEISVIEMANRILNTWDLSDCTLYVTLEPCIMCAGACIQARLKQVVFGAYDIKGGSFGSTIDLSQVQGYNHYPEIVGGILEEENAKIMKEYFKEKRENKVTIKMTKIDHDIEDIKKIRADVFIIEQEIDPSEEFDEYDETGRTDVVHVIARVGDNRAGTIRMILKKDIIKVGRVAVLKEYRHLKLGSRMLAFVEKFGKNNGYRELQLGAQVAVQKFYEANDYVAYGELFLDAGIDHIMMKKSIKK